jgi:outer membrane protein
MKQLKTLLIAALVFMSTSQVNAQAKVAHVDTNAIMAAMPEMLQAQKQLETLQGVYDKEFKGMVDEYQAKLAKYNQEVETVTEAMKIERSKEIQDMEKRIQDYRQTAQKELTKKEEDLMKPLYDKTKLAIEKVGKAKGYQYILNAAGLLLADGPDLTADVKKELGF